MMEDSISINTKSKTVASGGWKFWAVILLFALTFCDGNDDKDLHDVILEKVQEYSVEKD